MSERKRTGINTYFRQTAKAFRAAKQTQVFSFIKRNIPYSRVIVFSRKQFAEGIRKIKSNYLKVKAKLPQGAKRIR